MPCQCNGDNGEYERAKNSSGDGDEPASVEIHHSRTGTDSDVRVFTASSSRPADEQCFSDTGAYFHKCLMTPWFGRTILAEPGY